MRDDACPLQLISRNQQFDDDKASKRGEIREIIGRDRDTRYDEEEDKRERNDGPKKKRPLIMTWMLKMQERTSSQCKDMQR